MTQSCLYHDQHVIQRSTLLDPWGDTSQYARIPGNLLWPSASPSDKGSINIDPISPVDYASPHQTISQKNSLPLLQFGDWEEGQTYDEDPPTCIHYLIELEGHSQ